MEVIDASNNISVNNDDNRDNKQKQSSSFAAPEKEDGNALRRGYEYIPNTIEALRTININDKITNKKNKKRDEE